MQYIKVLVLLSIVLIGSAAQAAKRDALVVQGDNFSVSAMEPEGWKGDSVNARLAHVNLFYYRTNENIQNAKTPIKVLVSKKTDENTAEDLKADMEGYRKQYPEVQFRDLPVKHPHYRVYAKLFYLQNGFHEYVTYLNPGKKYPYIIAVSMTIPKGQASKEDRKAYAFIIGSIKALK